MPVPSPANGVEPPRINLTIAKKNKEKMYVVIVAPVIPPQ